MATWMHKEVANTQMVVIGGLVLCLLYYLGLRFTSYRTRRELILQHGCKSPASFPVWDRLLGLDNMYSMIRAAKQRTYLREKESEFEMYGNTYSSRLTTYPVINTIEPENIKTILSSSFEDVVIGTPRKRAFAPAFTRSILVADGTEWEHSRAFLKPSFTRSQVGDLTTLEVHTHNLLEAIPRDGSTVDLAELFHRYTADVITDFMFGDPILSLPKPEAFGGDLVQAFRDATLGAELRFRLSIFANVVPQRATYRSTKKIHAYMEAYVDKVIKERASQKECPENQAPDTGRHIFLQELVKLTDDRLTIRDQLLGIFFAGRDTTAALLSNLFFVLARDAGVWERLREEIGCLGSRKPTLEELKGMKYLSYCLNETLRLYPIVAGLSRVVTKDVVLPKGGGDDGKSPTLAAKGTLVGLHIHVLHKRKDLWGADAEEFRPERWQHEKSSWNFLPFGGGPRNCIGQQFALTEASYTAVRLIQEFSSIESRDSQPWTESLGATCTSANGVKVAMMS